MEGGGRHRILKALVTVVFLSLLVLTLIYFSFHGLNKVNKSDVITSEASVFGVMDQSIEGLNFQSNSAAGDGLPIDALTQSDYKAMEKDLTHEVVSGLLNSSLECDSNGFKFKALELVAAGLMVEMGNAEPLPLTQVPNSCGFSMKQTAVDVVVQVPYNGCGVEKQNTSYVLSMRWLENTIYLVCNVSSTETSATAGYLQQPSEHDSSLEQQSLRSKRAIRWPYMYRPCSPHHMFPLCLHTTPPPTTTTTTSTTTTAMPTLFPHVNPYVLHTLIELYPLYAHYLQNYPHHNRHHHKNPIRRLISQKTENHLHSHPLQHLFEKWSTTTPMMTVPVTKPCATTTTTTATTRRRSGGSGCLPGPWRRFSPFYSNQFEPRVSFNGQDLPSMAAYNSRSQVNPDSFWESFPLLEGSR